LQFLQARAIEQVECVTDEAYCRTVQIGAAVGWIIVRHVPERHALTVELTHSLTPVLPVLLGRIRNLFDVNARPDVICAQLSKEKTLQSEVSRNPGLRVPGAFDGFELAWRAILGQQVAVKSATTLAGRVAEAFGEPIETPLPALSRLSPTPERIANTSVDRIARLGILSARARSIIALANGVISGQLRLEAGADSEATIETLCALPGIGPWTAHYLAMRALRWPDAFPHGDVAVLSSLGGVTARQAEEMSQRWRPWRSYAVLHLWARAAAKAQHRVRSARLRHSHAAAADIHA
jgi:AraC family transcriptional regulator of adaptative response / DNA-3-methyladenine glycosylase II